MHLIFRSIPRGVQDHVPLPDPWVGDRVLRRVIDAGNFRGTFRLWSRDLLSSTLHSFGKALLPVASPPFEEDKKHEISSHKTPQRRGAHLDTRRKTTTQESRAAKFVPVGGSFISLAKNRFLDSREGDLLS